MLWPERVLQKQEPQQGYTQLLLRPQDEASGDWKGPVRFWVGEKYG